MFTVGVTMWIKLSETIHYTAQIAGSVQKISTKIFDEWHKASN